MKTKLFKNVVRDPAFYKSVLVLGLPIALQNMLALSVNIADTLMLGRADTTGLLLSASSLANQPFALMSTFCFGLSGGTSVLCTQYYGRGDYNAIRTIFAIVLRGAVYMTLLFALAVLVFPRWVMTLFTNDAATISAGVEYLRIVGWTYVFFGISYTLQCVFRTVAKVKISAVTSVASLVVNIVGNYVLIFGKLGFEPMGIRGAAIATLIARLSEFVIMCFYTFAVEGEIGFRVKHLFLRNRTLFNDFLKYGTPVFLNEAVWSLAMAVQASIIGHIDYTLGNPVAANSINDMINNLAILAVWGVATSAAVLVGGAIGEGDIEKARQRAHTFQYIAILLGLAASGIILIVRDPILNIYAFEASTHALAVEMINVTAVMQVFVSMTAVSIVGTLRSGGDTIFCFVSETAALWGFSIPAAFLAASVFNMPVGFVLFCMKSCEVIKAIVCHRRVVSGKFIKSVTRTADEIG